ncbi:MAG: hypothetical protein IJR35_06615, partial [Synergistaceae bacterium]|nr:hypothetical protein [Synergistaceae bacterium]
MDDVIHEIFKEAFDESKRQGIEEAHERVARDMLKMNLPLSLIEKISKLSGDTIRRLAESLGVAVIL